jgi:conjugal transfer pilus assembly protein TraW
MSAGTIEAKTLAVVGETFPVAEQSFLVFIESRLHQLDETGDMAAIEQQMILDASRHANRPTPVELPRATAHHTHEYTPRVVLANDILDHLNRVLIPRGTFVNALEQLPYYEPHWVFINADDEAQVHWVKRVLKVRPDSKVILTGGAIGSSERALNSEIFFDQSGRISHQLGIKHVPAKVSRDGMHLRIDELVIGENGDVR